MFSHLFRKQTASRGFLPPENWQIRKVLNRSCKFIMTDKPGICDVLQQCFVAPKYFQYVALRLAVLRPKSITSSCWKLCESSAEKVRRTNATKLNEFIIQLAMAWSINIVECVFLCRNERWKWLIKWKATCMREWPKEH